MLINSVDKESFQKDQFVLALFTDGAYPAQVVELVTDDKIKLNCLSPLTIGGEKNFRLWKWPSSFEEEKEETIDIASVLPISPVLDISEQYSNRRKVVFELVNYDYVKKFV